MRFPRATIFATVLGLTSLTLGACIDAPSEQRGWEYEASPSSGAPSVADGGTSGISDAGTSKLGDHPDVSKSDILEDSSDGQTKDVTLFQCRVEYDRDVDGSVERVLYRVFDETGELIKMKRDEGNNGTINRISSFEKTDNPFGEEQYVDLGDDGSVDRVRYFFFDDRERLSRVETDSHNDGTIDSSVVVEYESKDRLKRRLRDAENDGIYDEQILYKYRKNGRIDRLLFDTNLDGSAETIVWNEFNREGRKKFRKVDSDLDDQAESIAEFFYREDCSEGRDLD